MQQFYVRHKFFGSLDIKIHSFFATDTNNKFIAVNPDTLTFFLKSASIIRPYFCFPVCYIASTKSILAPGANVPIFRKVTKNPNFNILYMTMDIM
jgi:hypothetical protein